MDKRVTDSIEVYDGHVPAFIEQELERLYHGRHSCIEYFRLYQGLEGVSVYRAARAGEPQVILLFRHDAGKLWVLNQAIPIDATQLQQFADTMFLRYPRVRRIDFHAIATEARSLSYPSQCLMAREDIVADLPATVYDYLTSLGKNTQRNLRRYRERLLRDHPGFAFGVVPRAEIGAEHLRTLQRLSCERLDGKGRTSTIDDTEFHRLRQLSAHYGLVTQARIGDQVVGGMLCFVIGDGISFRIIAHDPAWNDYSLGFLIYFMTICEAIRLGCTTMNFGWDHYPYKLRLGGHRRRLAMLTLYRSRLACVRDAGGLLARRVAQLRQDLVMSLRDSALSGSAGARWLQALAGSARRLLRRGAAHA